MDMIRKEHCGNCKYWHVEGWDNKLEPFLGECKRYAPRPILSKWYDRDDGTGLDGNEVDGPADWAYWPITEIDDTEFNRGWCGEWQPQTEEQKLLNEKREKKHKETMAERGGEPFDFNKDAEEILNG